MQSSQSGMPNIPTSLKWVQHLYFQWRIRVTNSPLSPPLFSSETSRSCIVVMLASTSAFVSMSQTITLHTWKPFITSWKSWMSTSIMYVNWTWSSTSTRFTLSSMRCFSQERFERRVRLKSWSNSWSTILWSKERISKKSNNHHHKPTKSIFCVIYYDPFKWPLIPRNCVLSFNHHLSSTSECFLM